jgi:hypothetical protein
MAASYQWSANYGASPGTLLDLGASGNLFNFKNYDNLTTPSNYTSYPVTAGNNSYEVWLRAHFTGTFTTISNLQFWKSDSNTDTGISIKWDGSGNTVYATPINTTSTVATTSMPTSDPGTANVSIAGSLGGSLSAAGYSDYAVMQLQTTVAAAAGDSSTYSFTMQWDES